ncbi:MAG: hypothetical protein JXR84_13705 [Anaerolineae bacterium]|nr:hypothetical protein [Anaerolineae bacterium]
MNDKFEMPDMDELAKQMEEAMKEAQEAMGGLSGQIEGMGDILGSLSGLLEGMPAQMEALNTSMAEFGEQHSANVESMVGEPDWRVEANIRVGNNLHVIVSAEFDFEQVKNAWRSTQDAGFESLVAGVVTETAGEMEEGVMDQVLGQLKKGRSIALVKDVQIVACRIQGAPRNAAETLQLSPEGNIPLVMNEDGIGFEFAPMLTIRNRWERADIPTFVPMGEEIIVPIDHFEQAESFRVEFEPQEQEDEISVELSFEPLR